MIVVADSSPLQYLILLEQPNLLLQLYQAQTITDRSDASRASAHAG